MDVFVEYICCLYSIRLSLHCGTIFSGRIYSCVLSMIDCVRARMYGYIAARLPTHNIYLQIAAAIHDWRQSTRRNTIREKPPITSRNAKILSTYRSPSIIPSIISSWDGRMNNATGAGNVDFGYGCCCSPRDGVGISKPKFFRRG